MLCNGNPDFFQRSLVYIQIFILGISDIEHFGSGGKSRGKFIYNGCLNNIMFSCRQLIIKAHDNTQVPQPGSNMEISSFSVDICSLMKRAISIGVKN